MWIKCNECPLTDSNGLCCNYMVRVNTTTPQCQLFSQNTNKHATTHTQLQDIGINLSTVPNKTIKVKNLLAA